MRLQIAILSIFLSATASAYGEESIPFPQLQTEAYCKILVSKMLNPIEKETELGKCLVYELNLKAKLEPWWPILPPKTQKYILNGHYKDPANQTYITLLGYTASTIGDACLSGKIACKNPYVR